MPGPGLYSWGRSPRSVPRGLLLYFAIRLPRTFLPLAWSLDCDSAQAETWRAGATPSQEVNMSTIQIFSGSKRSRTSALTALAALLAVGMAAVVTAAPVVAQEKKPNILVIMGDDVGWLNIGAYHRGMMSGKTPNLDKLASQGMMFTDYYAEASCTAGRANFITGELRIRTGLTTVGQAGAAVGLPAQAATLATALKTQGYATGQFGKNHLGDLNKFLPTLHGFDASFGYLYHLDAMSNPYWYSYPRDVAFYQKYGPRN